MNSGFIVINSDGWLSRSEGTQASKKKQAQKQRIGFVLANAEREPQLKGMSPHRAQACSSWSKKASHKNTSQIVTSITTSYNFIAFK